MYRKIFTLFLMIVVALSSVTAERANTKSEYLDTGVGLNFQVTMGGCIAGLTYQHWFKNDWGIQGTVGALVNESLFYSADLQVQRLFLVHDLRERNLTALFGWMNAGVISTDLSEDYNESIIKPAINVGAGIGIEVTLFEHISIPVKMGFVGQFLNNPAFGLSLGAGLLYRF